MTTCRRASASGVPQGTFDGGGWGQFKSAGIEVGKVAASELGSIVTVRTGAFFIDHMLPVLTRVVTIVLGCSGSMAGGALGIDIDRATGPGWRRDATMAADA